SHPSATNSPPSSRLSLTGGKRCNVRSRKPQLAPRYGSCLTGGCSLHREDRVCGCRRLAEKQAGHPASNSTTKSPNARKAAPDVKHRATGWKPTKLHI